MDLVLPHFASQNEAKRGPFKIIIGDDAAKEYFERTLFSLISLSEINENSVRSKLYFSAEGGRILFRQPFQNNYWRRMPPKNIFLKRRFY
jgi:hypothetical protein